MILLTHSPHHGIVAYLAALCVLVSLTWMASVFLGPPLSWLPTTLYDLAALAAGSNARGHPYWWDWWRADALSRGARGALGETIDERGRRPGSATGLHVDVGHPSAWSPPHVDRDHPDAPRSR